MRTPGLAALVDDGVFMAVEAQMQLADTVGEHTWNVDLSTGLFRFEGDHTADYPVQFLGSSAPGPRSWLWGWANESGYDERVLRAAVATRDLGAQYRIRELENGEVPFDDETQGDPGYALGWDLSIAARVASKLWFGYSAEVGGGTRAWMLLDGLRLGQPDVIRISRVLGEGLFSTTVTDHRRAVSSYAVFRGIPWDGRTLTLPNGELTIAFDDQGRIGEMSTTARPS
jgi:hypothetical protein